MKIINLTETEINTIQSELFDFNFWLHQLGRINSENNLSTDNLISLDFYKKGKEYWIEIISKVQEVLCDKDNKTPKKSISDLIEGNKTEMIIFIVSTLINDLDLLKEVAIPMASLVLKKGLIELCLKS